MRTINRQAAPTYLRSFTPNFWAKDIADINFETLAAAGVHAVAFDADSTLLPFGEVDITEEVRNHLAAAREAGFIKKICIATNRRKTDLGDLAASLGINAIYAQGFLNSKPWTLYFNRVMNELDEAPQHCAMIGDKVFVDVYGGNRHGFNTVLVDALGEDSALDSLVSLRSLEKRITKKYMVQED